MDLNNLDDAAKFQELFVKPMVDAVKAELKPLTRTVYATRERVEKLEKNQSKALLGLAGLSVVIATFAGAAVDWAKKKIGLIIFLLIMLPTFSCAANHLPVPDVHPPVPPVLKDVNTGLNWLIIVSVLGVGVSIALFFILPQHRISTGLGFGALGVITLSLLLKVSLPFIPWVAGGLGVLAVGFLAYELWREYKTGHSVFDNLQGPE